MKLVLSESGTQGTVVAHRREHDFPVACEGTVAGSIWTALGICAEMGCRASPCNQSDFTGPWTHPGVKGEVEVLWASPQDPPGH